MATRYASAASAVAWVTGVTAVNAWATWERLGLHHGHGLARVAVGSAFAVTAALLVHEPGQRGNARLFVALTLVWTFDQMGLRDIGVLQPLSFLAGGLVPVLACAALLRYPRDRLDRLSRVFVTAFAIGSTLLQVGLLATGSEPWDRLGVQNRPVGLRHQHAYDLVLATKSWWLIGVFVVFLVLLVRHWRSLVLLDRRIVAPIIAMTAAAGALSIGDAVAQAFDLPGAVLVGEARGWSVAALAVAFAWSALQLRLAVSQVSGTMTDIDPPVTAEKVRDALRRLLGDPALDVLFWVPETMSYVDGTGTAPAVDALVGRVHYDVADGHGRPLARLVVDPSLRRHELLLSAAARVGGMALENARLEAGIRTQLAAVREARTRLLHVGLAQRRQLERDLHDGAQQQLLALGLRLSLIESTTTDEATVEAVRSARAQLHETLDELRSLAHGLYPAVLSQAGLGPALESVAERLPVVVRLDVPDVRWDPDVESTLFFVGCEGLTNAVKHAGPCSIDLTVRESDGRLLLKVQDDGVGFPADRRPSAVRGLRDRLEGLGGELDLSSAPGHGTTLVAAVPCDGRRGA